MKRSMPEPGTLAFTPIITFIACLGERMWLVASLSLYMRDPSWTFLATLGAIGSASVLAACAFSIDAVSRRVGATLRFAIRIFGAMFVAAAYLVTYLLSIVFAFHPATLMLTTPLLVSATIVGIASGLLIGGVLQAGDAGWRRLKSA